VRDSKRAGALHLRQQWVRVKKMIDNQLNDMAKSLIERSFRILFSSCHTGKISMNSE